MVKSRNKNAQCDSRAFAQRTALSSVFPLQPCVADANVLRLSVTFFHLLFFLLALISSYDFLWVIGLGCMATRRLFFTVFTLCPL